RRRGPALHAGLRDPARPDQRQWWRDRHGPSARCHGRHDPRHRAGRAGTPRSEYRPRHALHRRRHGHCNDHRTRLSREGKMTYENFTLETDADGIALVTWDMPGKSMNLFTEEVLDELGAIVDRTVADDAVKGVVITSGKSSFSGGADLSMIKSIF